MPRIKHWDEKKQAWVPSDVAVAGDVEVVPVNISIGNVETLPAGSKATASMTGTSVNLKLNLGLPSGSNGSATRKVLWSTDAAEGMTIVPASSPADYEMLELTVDCTAVGIMGAKLFGAVTEGNYNGTSISASAVVMGSGGYPYIFYTSIRRYNEKWDVITLRCRHFASNNGSYDYNCTLKKIVGYKLGGD